MIALNIDPDFLETYAVVQLLQGMLHKETNFNGDEGIDVKVIRSAGVPGFFIGNSFNDLCLIVTVGSNIKTHDKFNMTFGVTKSFELLTHLPKASKNNHNVAFPKTSIYRMTEFIRDYLLSKEPRVENYLP